MLAESLLDLDLYLDYLELNIITFDYYLFCLGFLLSGARPLGSSSLLVKLELWLNPT